MTNHFASLSVPGPAASEALIRSGAWPYQEAEKLLKRLRHRVPDKGYVLFSTGYGPSGLPHIGTFGEAVRTCMVMNAFKELFPEAPVKLFCVSDDLDGLRKIPDNVPNPEGLAAHLGKSLTAIPDPFGTHASYGAHMNSRLCDFLIRFGFEFEFISATERYRSGSYDETLLKVLRHFDEVMNIMLPELGEARRTTYNPFMPICPETGKVLQVPAVSVDAAKGTLTYRTEDGTLRETLVTGGACKLQWKPDWGMRWAALGVDYEMYGKDLQPSADVSGRICRVIGGTPPEGMRYELFLDDKGEKISKSKGNGLSADEWLRYAPAESLAYYMYQKPQTAKRLYFDVIPKAADEYLSFQAALTKQTEEERAKNPAKHVNVCLRKGTEGEVSPLSYSLLLNLAGACGASDAAGLWGFIKRYAPETSPETHLMLNELAEHAARFAQDRIVPFKSFPAPSQAERAALEGLRRALSEAVAGGVTDAEGLQSAAFEAGKAAGYAELREWFACLYRLLLGQETGPRFGSFAALFGAEAVIRLIDEALTRGA